MTPPEHWATVGTLHPGDRVLLTLDGRTGEYTYTRSRDTGTGHVDMYGARTGEQASRLLLADVTPHHPVRRTRQAVQT